MNEAEALEFWANILVLPRRAYPGGPKCVHPSDLKRAEENLRRAAQLIANGLV